MCRAVPAATANPWAFPWQSQYKGKVAILDDYREGLSLGLLKNGVTDLNTTDPKALTASQQSLLDLDKLVNLHIDNNDYTNIPSGQMWIHHSWSGDIAAAPSYMPKGVPVDVVGYWFPADGRGPINNDTLAVLKGAKNPVLAHLFLNYLLNVHNALENISWLAYMQPLTAITPERLIQEKILPRSLTSTAVTESMFTTGLRQLQLTATGRALWQKDWFTSNCCGHVLLFLQPCVCVCVCVCVCGIVCVCVCVCVCFFFFLFFFVCFWLAACCPSGCCPSEEHRQSVDCTARVLVAVILAGRWYRSRIGGLVGVGRVGAGVAEGLRWRGTLAPIFR